MKAPKPYVLLPGTAREALERYQSIFGGTLTLNTYADFERTDGPPDAIAHGTLDGTVALCAADAAPGESSLRTEGLMFSLLGTAEPATLHAWFEALSDGGRVVDPLQDRPWGAADGQVVDRFGLHWLIGYEHHTES
ncbi:MAG: VOC family protein [Actinomycetales bacterium]|nr:VOC family protein [Actinomycetales bacterium]